MSTIKSNTDPLKGPPDGVEANIKCAVTQFERGQQRKGKGKTERVIKSQATMPCKVMCAYSNGTVSISVRDIDLMVTLRLDEVFEILKAAADAAQALEETVQEYNDAELEAKWRELVDIPMDEADSPSGLILSTAWWVFPKGVDREDIWHWFDERHSKGVAYLLNGGAEA